MTIGELLGLLEGLPEDMEVRVATQPNWPMSHELNEQSIESEGILYLSSLGQGYLSYEVSTALGWN